MNILVAAPTDEARRFKRDLPPKGSLFLRRPHFDILRFAGMVSFPDETVFLDERVAEVDLTRRFDLVLLYADLNLELRILELASAYERRGEPVVVFGPMATITPETFAAKAGSVVIGDIANVWARIKIDCQTGSLKKIYRADTTPNYRPPWWQPARANGFDRNYQALHSVLGCHCPAPVKPICPQYLYYGNSTLVRPLAEVLGEIVTLPAKQIFLLDDDLSSNPEYYRRLFSLAWSLRKEWIVNSGPALFNHPELLKLLPKAGVRTVFLNEDWLAGDEVYEAAHDRTVFLRKHRQVQLLHSLRLLVGARILMSHKTEKIDFRPIWSFLSRLGIDLLELRVFGPVSDKLKVGSMGDRFTLPGILVWPELLQTTLFLTGFVWLKDQFYSFSSIFSRALRSLPKVGIYNTLRGFFPANLAYRQNYLEGISYPP